MQFIKTKLMHIDFKNREKPEVINLELTAAAQKFLEDITDVTDPEKNNAKKYTFFDDDVQMSSISLDIFNSKDNLEYGNDIFQANVEKIVNRFIRSEISTEERENFYTIENCSFIISLYEENEDFGLFIGKFDALEFYEQTSLEKTQGFSTKKNQRYYKISLVLFEEKDNTVSQSLKILESSSSAYWASTFMEARELTSDELNTKKAFVHLDNYLSANFKKESPQDYREMRNTLISEFRNNTVFKLTDIVDKVFSLESPQSDPTKIANVKDRTLKSFTTKTIDSQFSIVQKVVKARMSKKYVVNDDVTLNNTTGLTDSISLAKNGNGDDVLEILITNEDTIKAFRN